MSSESQVRKEQFLAELKVQLKSSPDGKYWDIFFQALKRRVGPSQSKQIPNPLILGGSIASHAVKHERLSEHLDWAIRCGCLDWAISYLERMEDKKWNIATDEKDWYMEHPWVTEGFADES